jgi:hypothetical protein
MLRLLKRINSKILLKITLVIIIEIILIIGSFGVLAYFQSQQSFLGNSINIAGKNRYLTANLLLQTEKYLAGSSDALQIKAATDKFAIKCKNIETRRYDFGGLSKTSPFRLFRLVENY